VTWRLPSKYLPASFHSKISKDILFALIGKDWKELGNEAQFIVLGVGLAYRDISAVHFREDGVDDQEDMPQWVMDTKWQLKDIIDILDAWELQLDSHDGETRDEAVEGKGKDKGKRRKTEGDENDDSGPK
jgi:hypothetical protein